MKLFRRAPRWARHHDLRARCRRRRGDAQLVLPGRAQAGGAVLSGERRAVQDADARPGASTRALFREHSTALDDARAAGGARAGRGRGQPGGAHAVARARIGRIRARSTARRRARSACTRSPTARSARRSATASATTSAIEDGLLVQQPLHARDPEPRGRDDLRLSRPQRRRHRCAGRQAAASSRRSRTSRRSIHLCGAARRRRLRRARLPPGAGPALRRARRCAPTSRGSTR